MRFIWLAVGVLNLLGSAKGYGMMLDGIEPMERAFYAWVNLCIGVMLWKLFWTDDFS